MKGINTMSKPRHTHPGSRVTHRDLREAFKERKIFPWRMWYAHCVVQCAVNCARMSFSISFLISLSLFSWNKQRILEILILLLENMELTLYSSLSMYVYIIELAVWWDIMSLDKMLSPVLSYKMQRVAIHCDAERCGGWRVVCCPSQQALRIRHVVYSLGNITATL
jgi:hypothetical protein